MAEPKARSATWLSSTYAVDEESEEAKHCSGGYQVMPYTMLISSVDYAAVKLSTSGSSCVGRRTVVLTINTVMTCFIIAIYEESYHACADARLCQPGAVPPCMH